MAVELTRTPIITYPSARNYNSSNRNLNLRLVNNTNNDLAKALASKAAFEASMERALLNKKYWDELLEKLRKSGGGGSSGSDTRFDRIAVSMMLTNFLKNKTLQAMIKNFVGEFFKTSTGVLSNLPGLSSTSLSSFSSRISSSMFGIISNAITSLIKSLNVPRKILLSHLTTSFMFLTAIAGVIALNLSKLKEIFEEELKESIKKLGVKDKIKKIKNAFFDFFVEMKEEILSTIEPFKFYLFMILKNLKDVV